MITVADLKSFSHLGEQPEWVGPGAGRPAPAQSCEQLDSIRAVIVGGGDRG